MKPCPFCGGKPKLKTGLSKIIFHVECEKCKSSGPMEFGKDEAINIWNTRVYE